MKLFGYIYLYLKTNTMKQSTVKVQVRDLRPQAKARVGDKVAFQIGEETMTDTITYIGSNRIEGIKWDLSNVKFTIL
jgi:hypothetical protein